MILLVISQLLHFLLKYAHHGFGKGFVRKMSQNHHSPFIHYISSTCASVQYCQQLNDAYGVKMEIENLYCTAMIQSQPYQVYTKYLE